jgi:hypothetical protein
MGAVSRVNTDWVLSPVGLERMYLDAVRDGDREDADAAIRLLAKDDPDRATRLIEGNSNVQ